MADIELRVVNESGELVAINLDGTADGKQVLRKEEIIALIESLQVSLGNFTFDGYFMYADELSIIEYDGDTFLLGSSASNTSIEGVTITVGLTDGEIDLSNTQSAITKGWSLAKFFQQSEFTPTFNGQAGVPVKTSATGKLDPSLVTVSVGELQGNWTPEAGTEYPDLTGMVSGDYWVIEGVGGAGNGYEFLTGQLLGMTIYDNAWMQLDTNLNWVVLFNSGGDIVQWGGIEGDILSQLDLQNQFAGQQSQITANANAITDLEGKIAAFQADSNAPSIGILVQDFNSLLAKLKDAGLMENS